MKTKTLELYLHIPFCVRKCAYCDFLSFSCGRNEQRSYVEKLLDEIHEMGEKCRDYTVTTIFVGGGTPSLLESEWMVEIMDCLQKNFTLAADAEISMEANPGTVNRNKLLDYKKAGINRLSFGLQSADDGELKLLSRIHTFEEFLESYGLARDCGFSNINIDLMSALPGQTVESWLRTLKAAVALKPEHISAYSLIIEEGTPFFERYGSEEGEKLLPGEEEDRRMYHETKEILKASGYGRYEISNYAKPGYECRHNVGYWTGVPYLGLGLGASSCFEGERFSNTEKLEEYLEAKRGQMASLIRRNKMPWTIKDQQEEFFFLGLRMTEGVDLNQFLERFGVSAEAVYPGLMEQCIKEGTAGRRGSRFFLTDYGLDVSSCVMARFLQD